MSNKRLIDGTALIEWLEQDPSQYKILPAIKSGRFDSNQGEAAQRVRESVQWFAEQMESRLIANDKKSGWENESREFLLERLEANYHALWARQQAYGTLYDVEGTIRKAANIANFAMMIADNARRLLGISDGGEQE